MVISGMLLWCGMVCYYRVTMVWHVTIVCGLAWYVTTVQCGILLRCGILLWCAIVWYVVWYYSVCYGIVCYYGVLCYYGMMYCGRACQDGMA